MRKKGFTLIELLLVITLVGILSVGAVAIFVGARAKTRDAKRITDSVQIQKALELYKVNETRYPPVESARTSDDNCGDTNTWCTLESELEPNYLTDLPRDASGLQTNYRYHYDSDDGDSYKTYGFMLRLEHDSNKNKVANDGGYAVEYNNIADGEYYEIGTQPLYCMEQYTGTNANWWEGGTDVCAGGD